MPIIQCQRCKRKVEVPFNFDKLATCNQCGGRFMDLNEFQGQFSALNEAASDLGSHFNQFPHVLVGNEGLRTNKPIIPQNNQNIPNLPSNNPNLPYSRQLTREEKFQKIKDYVFYGFFALVLLFAIWRIILSFL